ncbi:type II toxin-antitoxin system VapB family antitoxin [bacterium]|nr:type II toxin-antitoxin system VapB family antitoxin [bacterium]
MKTTVEIPNEELKQLIEFTGAKTKKDAINAAIKSYNKQQRLLALSKKLGTFENFIDGTELDQMRAE